MRRLFLSNANSNSPASEDEAKTNAAIRAQLQPLAVAGGGEDLPTQQFGRHLKAVGEQYLPQHLQYIGSYFRRSTITGCFYLTISLSGGTWLWLVLQAQRGAVEVSTGWILLATLLGLAIIEHVLMVFALPLQRLWGWAMRRRDVSAQVPTTGLPAPVDRA